MQAAPARYVSVSELYSTDEVELLLDEIRELEPTSCRGEDVQDFEIAGSGAGLGAGAGGRSPAGTERSWDSHAHYSRPPPQPPQPLAPLYCRLAYCLTLRGICSLLILLCSAATCCCIWSGVGIRLSALPLPGRVRLLMLGSLTSFLIHTTLLLMHITQLSALLPINWDRLGMCMCGWSAGSMVTGAALSLHALLAQPQYLYTPPALAALLYAAIGLGFGGGVVAIGVVAAEGRAWAVAHGGRSGHARTPRGSLAAYRAVPSAPAPLAPLAPLAPFAPQPSTSRDNPL